MLDKLHGYDCEVWSHREEWLSTIGPFGEIVVHMLAWMAQQQMAEHSAKVKLGMARARAEGKAIGGRKDGAKDKRRGARERRSEATKAAWSGPGGDARRAALAARNAARSALGRHPSAISGYLPDMDTVSPGGDDRGSITPG